MTVSYIYRADITVAGFGGTVLHYATRSYSTGAGHATLPNTWFDDRVKQPLLLRRDLYGQGRTYGDVEIAHGETVLQNADGALDILQYSGFDAQQIKIWRVHPDFPDTGDMLIFRGVMEQVTLDVDVVRILVRDESYTFDRPLQTTKYAGTNTLPNGLEGTADDIKGQPKPICYGVNFNITPPMVNTSRLIWQLEEGGLGAGFSLTVYDKRVPLGAGILRPLADFNAGATSATVSSINTATDVITTSAVHGFTTADPVHLASSTSVPGGTLDTQYYYARVLTTTTITLHPTAADASGNTNIVDITSAGAGTITVAKNRTPYGRYDWCSGIGGSYIRTGLQPTQLTCDLTNPNNTWYGIFLLLLNRFSTVGLSYQTQDRTSAGSPNIGVFWKEEITYYNALREVMQSIGGSFTIQEAVGSGIPYALVQRLQAPNSAASVLDLSDSNIVKGSLRRVVIADPERGIPPRRVSCNYKRNRTVMSASDLAGVAASDIAFASREYRSVGVNYSVAPNFPAAPEMTVTTSLTTDTDATTLATFLGNLYAPSGPALATQMFTLQVSIEEIADIVNLPPFGPLPLFSGLLPASTVKLTYPRFDLATGKYLVVIGYTLDYAAKTADLTLWG